MKPFLLTCTFSALTFKGGWCHHGDGIIIVLHVKFVRHVLVALHFTKKRCALIFIKRDPIPDPVLMRVAVVKMNAIEGWVARHAALILNKLFTVAEPFVAFGRFVCLANHVHNLPE